MPNFIVQLLKELAIPITVGSVNSVVQKVKGRKKKMNNQEELMKMIKEVVCQFTGKEELEFDKLTKNQQSVASATIDAMSCSKDIVDFITTMVAMCSKGDKLMKVSGDECKVIFMAILNDIASPHGVKFTIE